MSTREDYPAGVPCWVDTNQPDAAAAAEFYSELFGWETKDGMPPDSGENYFVGRLSGRDVGAISGPSTTPPVWMTYISVDDADTTAGVVRAAGGQVITEPYDVVDAGRMAVCADPEGAVFCLWQAGRNRGSAAVNEHGAVNFNNLHTDDLEGAAVFYGAVFGWETIDIGSPLWTLPGYGDHLEQINPGTRASFLEMGAPAGFIDVVAAVLPREGGPARWSVTFGVNDAAAAAEQARGLGGSVLAEPKDGPWVRLAVLADPAGAAFTVSQFVPLQD